MAEAGDEGGPWAVGDGGLYVRASIGRDEHPGLTLLGHEAPAGQPPLQMLAQGQLIMDVGYEGRYIKTMFPHHQGVDPLDALDALQLWVKLDAERSL